jgi:hypothetical protein
MREPSTVAHVRARPLAGPAAVIRRTERSGLIRPLLDGLGAIAAVFFLMSVGDLDTPVPYLCGGAALLSALGAELAR